MHGHRSLPSHDAIPPLARPTEHRIAPAGLATTTREDESPLGRSTQHDPGRDIQRHRTWVPTQGTRHGSRAHGEPRTCSTSAPSRARGGTLQRPWKPQRAPRRRPTRVYLQGSEAPAGSHLPRPSSAPGTGNRPPAHARSITRGGRDRPGSKVAGTRREKGPTYRTAQSCTPNECAARGSTAKHKGPVLGTVSTPTDESAARPTMAWERDQ